IVFTEYDMRARLHDWLAGGASVESWAYEVGLMLPEGTRPTRENVLVAMNTFNATTHWHSLRRPSLDVLARRANLHLLGTLGLLEAAREDYGRLSHRTISIPLRVVVDQLL